jgi:hypothetical protein
MFELDDEMRLAHDEAPIQKDSENFTDFVYYIYTMPRKPHFFDRKYKAEFRNTCVWSVRVFDMEAVDVKRGKSNLDALGSSSNATRSAPVRRSGNNN